VPRIDLIEQTVKALYREGLTDVGVIQGKHSLTNSAAVVQVCSEQTLVRRDAPQADLIFIDECHLQFKKINDWINSPELQSVPVIGLSATPWSRGLGNHFKKLIKPTSIAGLIEKGHLVPFSVFAPPGPHLSTVRTLAGDFNESDLSTVCDTSPLVANIVDTWQKRGEDRQTLLFAIDRKHAKHLEERFNESSITCEYVDGDVPMFERQDVFARFRSRETRVISSIGTLDTGVDLPICSCVIEARPTKSVIRYVQTIGRGLRVFEGKQNLIILDHAGNTVRLGLVTDIDSDVLDDGDAVVSAERSKERKTPEIQLCPECHAVLPSPKPSKCPQCGHVFWAVTKYVERDGDLVEFGSGAAGDTKASLETKQHWYGAFLWICDQAGTKRGRAFYLYQDRFKEKPPWSWQATVKPVPPSVEQRNFVRARDIAFAKASARYG
jgi:DNA repair protein RadD